MTQPIAPAHEIETLADAIAFLDSLDRKSVV